MQNLEEFLEDVKEKGSYREPLERGKQWSNVGLEEGCQTQSQRKRPNSGSAKMEVHGQTQVIKD